MITSIVLNAIVLLKCKIIVIYWLLSHTSVMNMNNLRKFFQIILILFEPFCIILTPIAILRFDHFWAVIAYAIIFVYNVFYTLRITGDNQKQKEENEEDEDDIKIDDKQEEDEVITDDFLVKDFCFSIHDYL